MPLRAPRRGRADPGPVVCQGEGLEAGSRVIVTAPPGIAPDQKVQVREQAPAEGKE